MKTLKLTMALVALAAGSAFVQIAASAEATAFSDELLAIQREFDAASFSGLAKSERKQAFEALVEHAAEFSARYPDAVEAVAWNGIVLSSFAGEVSAFGAMKYANAARAALHQAEAMSPEALDGGIYASLGALYSKVPGGFMGFGDTELAAEYFGKALAVDPDNLDSNFFYGEFLLEQEKYEQATAVLQRALNTPKVESRPLLDLGRREMIRELLQTAEDDAS